MQVINKTYKYAVNQTLLNNDWNKDYAIYMCMTTC